MSAAPTLQALFEQLAAALEPHMRDAVLAAFAALGAAVDESHLRAALEQAGTDRARLAAVVDVLLNDSVTSVAFQPMKDALRAAVAHGGDVMARSVGAFLTASPAPAARAPRGVGGTIEVVFNPVHPRVIAAIRESEAALFPQLGADMRAGAVQLLADAVASGKAPADAARVVRPLLGLTEHQAKIVANYRRELEAGHAGALDRRLRDKRFDKTVQKAIGGDVALTPAQVERMTSAYAQRLLNQSAETFARTESINALKRSQTLAWQEAIDSGAIAGGDLVKTWKATHDSRTRPEHIAADGLTVPFDEPYPVDGGVEYPGQGVYNCRCTSLVRPRWVAERHSSTSRAA